MLHVCNVEEVGKVGFAGFLHWHFTCVVCKARCQMGAGATSVSCWRCKTSYVAKSNGAVFRESPQNVQVRRQPAPIPPMGVAERLASKIVSGVEFVANAAIEANEAGHCKRLREGVSSASAQMKTLDAQVIFRLVTAFNEKCDWIACQMPNWSTEGRIKMGREMQARARVHADFNQSEALALWLAGAWLESGSRPSSEAARVHRLIENLRENC